jgi:hypothetical protein
MLQISGINSFSGLYSLISVPSLFSMSALVFFFILKIRLETSYVLGPQKSMHARKYLV